MKQIKNKLINLITYYKIIQLAGFGLLLLLSKNYILSIACKTMKLEPKNLLYLPFCITITIGLLGLWILVTLNLCRSRYYTKITGRIYRHDSKKYRRTIFELIDYFENADPHKLDTSNFPEINWRNANGFVFGRDGKKLISIPENCESNIAIAGPPGSGKSSMAIITLLTFKGSVLAIDVKSDLYNFCRNKRKIIRFCPDSPTALQDSCHFNPLAGIHAMTPTDKKLYIDSMATILIPDEGGSDGNYFTTRARKYFQGIVHLLLFQNPQTTFPDIVHAILRGNPFDWVTTAMESECNEAIELLSSFYGNSEKNLSGVYDTLCSNIASFSNDILDVLLTDNDNCISIKTLEDGWDIYLQISQQHLDSYASLFTLIIQYFSVEFSKRTDSSTASSVPGIHNRPILMLCDEFPALTFSYKLINSNLSTLRSKSIITCLIFQNLSQIEYKYQPAGARALLGNCNYQIILGSNDINTGKLYSETFGTKKVLKVSNTETASLNNSSGQTIQEAREPVFYPEDFGDLPARKQAIIYFKGKHCLCEKLNCYTD